MKNKFLYVGLILVFVCLFLFGLVFFPNVNIDSNGSNSVGVVDYSQLTYSAIGDSITAGTDGETKTRMANPYPQLVAQILGLKSVDNSAIGGMFLSNNNPYMTDCVSINCSSMKSADIISVAGGVNDFLNGVALGSITDTGNYTIYGSLNMIAKELTEKYPNSFIFFITPFRCFAEDWCSGNNGRGYSLADVSIAMKNVAVRYGIAVFDCYSLIDFSATTDTKCFDGLHPTQSFHTNYTAPAIAQFIKDNYKK